MPIFRLTEKLAFPPPHMATPEGLLAVGGDLRPERLLLAYQHGIFPWYSAGEPILWWSPDPRLVMPLGEMHVSRSLRKVLRQNRFRFTFDHAFDAVIDACATAPRPRQRGTWITPDMLRAYRRLHALGYAHSIECWQHEQLVGGVYGVSLGACFYGESMFSRVSNASKVALVTLVDQLRAWNFTLFDCQVPNHHLLSLGAVEIARADFLRALQQALRRPTRCGSWKE
jgi:leucyl/phenylalanyl-tRNA---protein transferase